MSREGLRLLKGKERSPFGALVATQIKSEYGFRGLSEKMGLGKHGRSVYLYIGLLVMSMVPVVALVSRFAQSLARLTVMMGQPGVSVVLAVTAGQGLVLFVGISGLMSILYYSDDLELLQALPFTAKQIMLGKAIVAYVAVLIASSIVALPFLVVLGLEIGSLAYWVPSIFVTFAVPGIPLALGLLAVVLIMRATGRSKKKDLFRVLLGLVIFALIMVFQYLNMSMTRYGPEAMTAIIMEKDGLIQVLTAYYPPLRWAAWALTGDSGILRFAGLTLFVGTSMGILLVVSGVAQRWFLGGISRSVVKTTGPSVLPAARSKGKGTSIALNGNYRSPTMAVFFREHRMLTRTPNFLLISLTNLAILPIMWIVTSFTGGQAGFDMMPMLRGMIPNDILVLGAVGAHGILVGMNQVASTGVSREGPMFWFSKAIPVSPRDQVRGKVLYGLAFATVQLCIVLAMAKFLVGVDLIHLGLIAFFGLLVAWPITVICMLNDLTMPKLQWTNPQQAMKGNFATLLAGILSAAYLAMFFVIIKFAYPKGLTDWLLYGAVAVLLVVTGVLLQRLLDSWAVTRYRQIEV